MWVHTCYHMHLEVKGKPTGVTLVLSFHLAGSGHCVWVISLGSKHPYLLRHLLAP